MESNMYSDDAVMITTGRVIMTIGLTFFYYLLVFKHILTPLTGQIGFDGLGTINLIIHEAGHFFFLPFQAFSGGQVFGWGMLLYIMGGTILQWFAPLLFVGYFALKQQWFSMLVIVFWFGESLLYSVPYIADAKAMAIPLLADGLIHDWNYILTDFNLLEYAQIIAQVVKNLAIGILTISVVGCWVYTLFSGSTDT